MFLPGPDPEWCDTGGPGRGVPAGRDTRSGRSVDQTAGDGLLRHSSRLRGGGLE